MLERNLMGASPQRHPSKQPMFPRPGYGRRFSLTLRMVNTARRQKHHRASTLYWILLFRPHPESLPLISHFPFLRPRSHTDSRWFVVSHDQHSNDRGWNQYPNPYGFRVHRPGISSQITPTSTGEGNFPPLTASQVAANWFRFHLQSPVTAGGKISQSKRRS